MSGCGHEFTTSKSLNKLLEKLDKIPDPVRNGVFDFKYHNEVLEVSNKKVSMIQNYEMPVTKENLL